MQTAKPDATTPKGTIDQEEVERFSRIAAEWWDSNGKFRPLHQIGPPRLAFIRKAAVTHFSLDSNALRPLAGLSVLDIGCGGGLVSEPLCRLGAKVTGIDPSDRNIAIANDHARGQRLEIDYRQARTEDLVARGELYDIVACLEVVEHVPDVSAFIAECAALVRPGGIAIFSTLNRTYKAWLLAILGAEYVLRWLPRGTHQWDRFVTPAELAAYAQATNLINPHFEGIVYNPFQDSWSLSPDTDVNYIASFTKAG